MKGQNMKKIKYLFIVTALGFMATSCYDLDLEPKGLVYENVLMKSESGVMKYLTLVYQDLPVEDFNYGQNGDQKGYGSVNAGGWHNGNQWSAQKSSPASAAGEASGRATSYGDSWDYWPYDRIRDINNLIEAFPNYREYYKEDVYNAILGEAHFLRAYYYFGIVKRYGGVPIVDKVLDPKAPAEELQQPRDTEYDCWKFIYSDLKYAMENASADKTQKSRANRYAAAALMSRAMLYAGSIAKYGGYIGTTGPAVDAGLMGISTDKAEEFFKYAYDAGKFIKAAGYKLHTGADKEKAYTEVFIEDTDEDIFIKQYGPKTTTPDNTMLFHLWDAMVLPIGENLSSFVGCALQPVWQMIGLYEVPAITDENDKPIYFDRIEDFWDTDEMEPRARANFFFSGMTDNVSGVVLDFQGGVYRSFPGTVSEATTENYNTDYTQAYRVKAQTLGSKDQGMIQIVDGQQVKVSGVHGHFLGTGDEGYIHTGAAIRKYVNYNAVPSSRTIMGSNQSWKTFRYGEILCNLAEAAYELGLETNNESLKTEAFEYVNEIRDRAGASRHEMVSQPDDIGSPIYGFPIDENLQYIRDERTRELVYENHRIFDLRRWRVADIMFQDGLLNRVLLAYYVLSEGKYIFLNEADPHGRRTTFDKKWYYQQIPGGEIGKNPLLIRNDGY